MTKEHIAAAHAETPTCNAGPDQPLTSHSLACRTKAFEASLLKAQPRLTLVPDCGPPCATCETCARNVCTCETGDHVGSDGSVLASCCAPQVLCADCDLCDYCGKVNASPVVRGTGQYVERYCSAACADEEGDVTTEAPAFTWGRAVEVMDNKEGC